MDANADYLRLLLLEDDSSKFEGFRSSANCVKEAQLLTSVNKSVILSDVIPLINAKVHGRKEERAKGLIILRKILPQCPSDVLSDHCFSWMHHCCRWDAETANEELKVLRVLINYSSTVPDTKKQVISNLLSRFSDRLINHRSNKCAKVITLKLKCLKSIIDHYGSSCGPYRNDFHKFVIHCLKQFSERKKVVREAALCYVSLCRCASKGQHGANLKELWSSQFKALIDTCHKLFDSVYSCVDFSGIQPKVETEATISALLELCDGTSENPISRFHGWRVTFSVLGKLLQYMIVCKYPVRKSFKPDDVYALVCRLLAVNGNVLKNCSQTNDIRCLSSILPDVHATTLDILQTLVRVAKRNLISYGTLMCKICLQTLKWTQPAECKYAAPRPYQSLRCKVYAVLSSWLSVAGSSSSVEIFADEIIPIAVSDIEFLKPEIQLAATIKPAKGKKRKIERNSAANSHRQFDASMAEDRLANKEMCVAAHRMLQSMIRNTHSLMKWENHKTLQYTVIPLASVVVRTNRTVDCPLPYSSGECRLQLFSTLYALTKWPHWRWKTPLSVSSRVFNAARNDDDDFDVSSFCALAANELETTTHPRGPSLMTLYADVEGCGDGRRDRSALQSSSAAGRCCSARLALADVCAAGSADAPPRRVVAVRDESDAVASLPNCAATSTYEFVPEAVSVRGQVQLDVATVSNGEAAETVAAAAVAGQTALDIYLADQRVECPPGICPSASEPIRSTNSSENRFSQLSPPPPPPPSPPENSAPRKRPKIDTVVADDRAEHDPELASMLDDFVDTIQ